MGRVKRIGKITGRPFKRGLQWLLKADFSKMRNRSAPLPSPLEVKPGPGELVIADPQSQLSISGGALVCGGAGATNDLTTVRLFQAIDSQSGLAHFHALSESEILYVCQQHSVGIAHALACTTTTIQWRNDSMFVSIGGTYPLAACSIRVSRHVCVLLDGMLWWVDDITPPESPYAPYTVYVGAQRSFVSRAIRMLSLPANGYTEWERDGSEVTDSGISSWLTQEDNAEFRLALTAAPPTTNSSLYFRAQSASHANCYELRADDPGTGITRWRIFVRENGAITSGLTLIMDSANNEEVTLVLHGSNMRLYLGGMLVADVDDTTWLRGTNWMAAPEFCSAECHPYPALGPAYSRAICPQVGETLLMPSDALIRWENVKLPPTGEYRTFRVRYVDDNNTLTLKLYDTGQVDLLQTVSGSTTTVATLASGTHSDGDALTVRLNGGDAWLWSGATSTSGTTSHTSGTTLKDGGAYGDRLACDEVAVWPIDMTNKLPHQLWRA